MGAVSRLSRTFVANLRFITSHDEGFRACKNGDLIYYPTRQLQRQIIPAHTIIPLNLKQEASRSRISGREGDRGKCGFLRGGKSDWETGCEVAAENVMR